jgi:hypothetical protein
MEMVSSGLYIIPTVTNCTFPLLKKAQVDINIPDPKGFLD